MADIILIHPKSGDYIERRVKPYIPLSLLSVSVFAVKEYSIKIIDMRVDDDWDKALLRELKANPVCVGITLKGGKYITYGLMAAEIVKNNSNSKVVLGGIFPTIICNQAIENKLIDFVICGEGEVTLLEIAHAIEHNSDFSTIRGLVYKDKGKIRYNKPRGFIDLNCLPEVPYHLINIKDYFNKEGSNREFIMETSRGCPNSCSFCYSPLINLRRWRRFNEDRVIYNIENIINKYNISSFSFVDDNFFVSIPRAKKIASTIIKNNLDIRWSAGGLDVNTSAWIKDDELKILEKSGCIGVLIGAETGSSKTLNNLNKRGSIDQLVNFNRRLRKYSIRPGYFFCIGFPGETLEDLKKTTDLILRLLKDNEKSSVLKIFCFNPLPNTESYRTALDNGFNPPKDLEAWSGYDWKTADFPWLSKEFTNNAEALYFLSLFLDNKMYNSLNVCRSFILKELMKKYGIIARLRLKHSYYNFLIEKKLCDKIRLF